MSKNFPKSTAERYDRWFQTPFGSRAATMEKQVLQELLGPGDGQSLLDIGCGTGYFTEWVRTLGYEVAAVDSSETMLKAARSRFAGEVQVRQMEAELLRFPPDSFDMALMMTSLEFTDDPARALREAVRVSQNGIVVGVLNRYNPLAVWRKLTSLIKGGTYKKARFFSAAQLIRMCKQAAEAAGKEVTVTWTGGVCLGQALLRRPVRNPGAAFIAVRASFTEKGFAKGQGNSEQ
ncbi:MAG: class I SAM-dependent methyltransferase [Armatimonadota bacterium]